NGTWQVTAISEPAQRSVRLIVTIPEQGPVEVDIDRPQATEATRATSTTIAIPTPTRQIAPVPGAPEILLESSSTPISRGKMVSVLDLSLSVLMLGLVGFFTFRVTAHRRLSLSERLTRSLAGCALGLVGYILYALGSLPLERIPWVRQAVTAGLPDEVLPVSASLLFFGLGWWMAANPHVRRIVGRIVSGH
ncbi:MAG: hypothetical protein NZ765_10575, partial [Anaerolineae bacterium]|nr:hypothetical protein [Anaerolineae bacterium]MDW8072028.1 hypothetical protein [Anaerolineae bacterium]